MTCNCDDFCWELTRICIQILAEKDKRLQWKMFEQFLTKYIEEMSDMLLVDTSYCPANICPILFNKLTEFKHRGMALSTVIVDLICLLYFKQCAQVCLHWLWDTEKQTLFSREREALRGLLGLLSSNTDFMKLLLDFGLLTSLPADSRHLMEELKTCFQVFIIHISDDGDFRRISKRVIKLLKGVFFRYESKESCKRMYLAVKAARAIQLNLEKQYSTAERTISCLRMYFTGTKDPFLSVFEVRSVLYACFILTNKMHLFDIYCEEYDKLMPQCPAKVEPRKLTHFARCQIRENFSASHLPLSSTVDRIPLPTILKRFVLSEIDDISIKRENSSLKSVTAADLESMMLESQITYSV